MGCCFDCGKNNAHCAAHCAADARLTNPESHARLSGQCCSLNKRSTMALEGVVYGLTSSLFVDNVDTRRHLPKGGFKVAKLRNIGIALLVCMGLAMFLLVVVRGYSWRTGLIVGGILTALYAWRELTYKPPTRGAAQPTPRQRRQRSAIYGGFWSNLLIFVLFVGFVAGTLATFAWLGFRFWPAFWAGVALVALTVLLTFLPPWIDVPSDKRRYVSFLGRVMTFWVVGPGRQPLFLQKTRIFAAKREHEFPAFGFDVTPSPKGVWSAPDPDLVARRQTVPASKAIKTDGSVQLNVVFRGTGEVCDPEQVWLVGGFAEARKILDTVIDTEIAARMGTEPEAAATDGTRFSVFAQEIEETVNQAAPAKCGLRLQNDKSVISDVNVTPEVQAARELQAQEAKETQAYDRKWSSYRMWAEDEVRKSRPDLAQGTQQFSAAVTELVRERVALEARDEAGRRGRYIHVATGPR